MTQLLQTVPRAALRGVASGVLFMAFFGTLWATIGVGGMHGWGAPWLFVASLLVGVALLGGGGALWQGSGRLHDPDPNADNGGQRNEGPWFGVIFGVEGVAIAVASVACNATGHSELFFPIMALIVGIHFFPLAWLFQHPPHYLTGALLCLLAVVALVIVPVTVTLGARDVLARAVVVGFGCALILWGTGLVLWMQGRQLLRDARLVPAIPHT